MSLTKSLRKKFTNNWPPWGSMRHVDFVPATFTIRMDANYNYFSSGLEDPDEQFELAQGFFEEIQELMRTLEPSQVAELDEKLELDMVELIYGSNYIETAGADYNTTLNICRKIFNGSWVEADIDERDPEYAAARAERLRRKLKPDHDGVLRSRMEIIQHALALRHITNKLVIENEALTEELILETHAILCRNIELEDGGKQEAYAGVYRQQAVRAGLTSFPHHSIVPYRMKQLVREFNQDVANAEESGYIDPYNLAAKYCHKFVNIHPFLDGNGRTCRLILNAILLKYAGIIVPIGETDSDRDQYLDIAAGASQIEMEDDEDRMTSGAGWSELATFVLQKATMKLRNMKEILSENL